MANAYQQKDYLGMEYDEALDIIGNGEPPQKEGDQEGKVADGQRDNAPKEKVEDKKKIIEEREGNGNDREAPPSTADRK